MTRTGELDIVLLERNSNRGLWYLTRRGELMEWRSPDGPRRRMRIDEFQSFESIDGYSRALLAFAALMVAPWPDANDPRWSDWVQFNTGADADG